MCLAVAPKQAASATTKASETNTTQIAKKPKPASFEGDVTNQINAQPRVMSSALAALRR